MKKLCNDILELDQRVRFAAIYDKDLTKLAGGMRNGLESYIPDELTKVSVDGAFMRWKNRKNMSDWLGVPYYAFAEYEKARRYTFYLPLKTILLVTTEKELEIDGFARQVIDKIDATF